MTKKTVSKRWSATEAQRVLEEQRRSGLSDRAFARKKGLDPQRLWWWRKRLEGSQGGEAVEFVEVKPKARTSEAATSDTMLEVRLVNGRVVMVPAMLEPKVLARLLDAIEGRSC
jgi:hypothetical protein